MDTFTLQDLETKNYVFVDENNEPLKNSDGQEITNVREYIRIMAQRISQRRKDNADSVREAKFAIDKKADEALNNIEIISKSIPSLVQAGHFNSTEGDNILASCKEVADNIVNYQRDINILFDRISHGKIRISSVGLHRQGKTIFTRLFTGLGSEILPSLTGLTDTTGTLVVLNHVKEDTDATYTVSFYTKEEILKTVNEYIRNIRSQKKDWTIRGYSFFSSIEEVKALRGCDKEIEDLNKDLSSNTAVNVDYIDGLAPYFRIPSKGEEDWIDCLTEKEEMPKPLGSVDDLRKYILMNESLEKDDHSIEIEKKTLYLAVRDVRINIPFKRNGDLFELIEIVDTKGGGGTAGSHVNNEIKKAIDMSDAVFSLHKTTTSEYNFYDELAKLYGLKSGLKEKHFIIINKVITRDKDNKVEKNNDVNTVKEQLERYNQADISYCGDLNDGNAHHFANYIIADMLYHIAKHVNKFDNDRIKNCNTIVESINKEISNLCLILDNPYTCFDEKAAIERNIKQMVADAKKYIESQISLGNAEEDPDQSPEYNQLKNENKAVKTLYWLITGNYEPNNDPPKALDEDKSKYRDIYDDDPDEAAIELLRAVYDVFPKIKSSKIPNEEHVGEYIEVCVNKLNKSIAKRINDLTVQERIGIKERDEIFEKLWTIFKLNQCFSSDKNWSNSNIQTENSFFEELYSVFNEKMSSTGDNPKDTLCAYKILKEYFKDANNYEEITPPIYVDDLRLRAIIAQELNHVQLDRTIVNMSTKDKRTRSKIAKKVKICLKGDEIIANLCESFYSYYKNTILSTEDLKEIDLSNNWQKISNAKKALKESFKALPLLN